MVQAVRLSTAGRRNSSQRRWQGAGRSIDIYFLLIPNTSGINSYCLPASGLGPPGARSWSLSTRLGSSWPHLSLVAISLPGFSRQREKSVGLLTYFCLFMFVIYVYGQKQKRKWEYSLSGVGKSLGYRNQGPLKEKT
jgi:hypothetical protein